MSSSSVVICGAGIAGISAAYFLCIQHGIHDIVLVDERPPLSLTSDKSTECYRNWWPGPGDAMVGLMNRSIDLLEDLAHQSDNIFHLNRRGYLYATAQADKIDAMRQAAQDISTLGGGPLRVYTGAADDPDYLPASGEGFEGQPDGADLFLDGKLVLKHFPYLSGQVAAAIHVRRAGWFSSQQLGMYLLKQALDRGVRLIQDQVAGFEIEHDRLQAVRLAKGGRLLTGYFVNAAGPLLNDVARRMGLELPIYHELHMKASFHDYLGVLPREAPLLIWNDPQHLDWSTDERQFLAEDGTTRWLLEELPAGCHTRPEGGVGSQSALLLWDLESQPTEPVFPLPLDPFYAELALRGMSRMLPGLRVYLAKLPKPYVDGGYYTHTRENRPLIGRLPIQGAFVIGALSGYGLMAACGAGELLANCLAGSSLPGYAAAFSLERYSDPHYLKLLENWRETGQL